jgi:DNA-binding NtrC family response regulator
VSLRNALEKSALADELGRIKRSQSGTLTFKDIVTRSPKMLSVLRGAEKAAASHIPVLVEGESGVGKELIARAIHGQGERRAKPFIAGQLRRHPRQSRRVDPVRPREGRLHRRDREAPRQVRRSLRRYVVPR